MEGGSQQNNGHDNPSYLPTWDSFYVDPRNPIHPNLQWTQDHHDRFLQCVNCLGGAEKATPKAILKLMDTEGLTIFDVKTHLHRFRIAKYMQESAEGRSGETTSIQEALQLQLDVQRQLHEQLEIQRNLQLRIEEHGRQLQMMFDLQQKHKQTNFSLTEMENSNATSPDGLSSSLDDLSINSDS